MTLVNDCRVMGLRRCRLDIHKEGQKQGVCTEAAPSTCLLPSGAWCPFLLPVTLCCAVQPQTPTFYHKCTLFITLKKTSRSGSI